MLCGHVFTGPSTNARVGIVSSKLRHTKTHTLYAYTHDILYMYIYIYILLLVVSPALDCLIVLRIELLVCAYSSTKIRIGSGISVAV